jgi:hypothetical protein
VSRVSKPAAGATSGACRLGSRRYGRFGNLCYEPARLVDWGSVKMRQITGRGPVGIDLTRPGDDGLPVQPSIETNLVLLKT